MKIELIGKRQIRFLAFRTHTADHVKHGPTGEDWVVAYVRKDKLSACGWPDTIADLSDCTLIKKATAAERLDLLKSMARGDGHRAAYAMQELDRIAGSRATNGVASTSTAAAETRNGDNDAA